MQVIKRVLPLVLISLGLLAGYYLMNQRQDKRSSAAAESPSLLILPSEITNKPVNEEFTVRASVLTPTTHRITGYDLTLKFDPAVLEFVRYEVPLATDVGGGNVFHLPDPTDPTDNIFNMPLDPAAPRFYDNSAGTVRIMDALSNGSKGGTVYLQKLVFKVKQVTPTKLTFPTGVTANCGGMATMMTNQGVDMDAPVCVNYLPENQLTVNPAATTPTKVPPGPDPTATSTPTAIPTNPPPQDPTNTPNPVMPECTNLELYDGQTKIVGANAASVNLDLGKQYRLKVSVAGPATDRKVGVSAVKASSVNCSATGDTVMTRSAGAPLGKDDNDVLVNSSTADYVFNWTPALEGDYYVDGRVWDDGRAEARGNCAVGAPTQDLTWPDRLYSANCKIRVNVTDKTSGLVMQATNMTLNNYSYTDTDAFCSASNGILPHIKLTGEVTGSASKVFTGAAGNYNVKVVYYDESDGSAPLVFKVDGVVKFNWTMNQYTNTTEVGNASCVANNGNMKEFVGTEPLTLNSSSIISLTSTYTGGEFARIAKIVFTPALGLDPGNTGARECQEGLPAKTLGNASNPDPHDSTLIQCNNTIDIGDFETWRHEAVDGSAMTTRETRNDWLADFNQDQIVDLLDFQIWNNSYGIRPTSTPPL